jgi:anti-anti-sigma factor
MSNSTLVIELESPEWDISLKDELELALAPALKHPRVVIDLSAVTYMDSTCLGKLAVINQKRVLKHGFAHARLVITSPNIEKLFRTVKFDKIWPIFGSLDEAIGADPDLA